MPNKLITNLDLWASAVRNKSTAGRGSNKKIELSGIKKLRELILELAVRGKLVPQNPDDEPASELLKRIDAEKAQLFKDGKLKKQKPLPPVTDEEKPFELPESWGFARLGQLIKISSGDGLTSAQMASNGTIPVFGGNGVNGYHDKANISERTLVIGRVGFYCGSIHITPELAWVTDNAFITTFDTRLFSLEYLALLLSVTNLKENENATAQPVISGRKVYPIPICFPPRAEQQRIVAKVDELMTLCDQLEQQSEHQLDAHQQLTETLLSTLTDAADAQELSDNWQRLAQHFDLLFSGPVGAWAIDRLKDTILQLAVMGKLVPQNPDDEPASELLKRIDAEKARLVKEGKIKKQKPLPPVSDDEKLFELPKGWEWSRLLTLGLTSTGKTPSTSQLHFFDGEIPFIGPGQISSSGNISKPEKYLSELGMLESTEALPNDIITVCIGGSIGKSAVVTFRMAFNQQINLIRPLIVNHHYIFQAVSTEKFNKMIVESSSGSATPIINRSKWESLPVPVPPLAEQHRIVAKVDELFALCDQLKERLQHASDTQLNLTDAIVEKALNS